MIFTFLDYEATNQTHAEYLDDSTKSADAYDVPSGLIKITEQVDKPLSPEDIALDQMNYHFCQEMGYTVGRPSSKCDFNIVQLLVRKSPLDCSLQIVIWEMLKFRNLYLSHVPALSGYSTCRKCTALCASYTAGHL